MTLDHLRIVNRAVAGIITDLKQGKIPPGRASTAGVKPDSTTGIEVLPDFKESCAGFLEAAAKPPLSPVAVSYPHPWFGPLDSTGWHALGAFHLNLHRKQLERILETMAAS